MDITFSLLGIALLTPFFVIISLYIYFLDGSGVVIKQNRVGLHGKQFKMYKFRTMKKGSHEMREKLQDLNQN